MISTSKRSMDQAIECILITGEPLNTGKMTVIGPTDLLLI
jgi:hypothetical protein